MDHRRENLENVLQFVICKHIIQTTFVNWINWPIEKYDSRGGRTTYFVPLTSINIYCIWEYERLETQAREFCCTPKFKFDKLCEFESVEDVWQIEDLYVKL